MFSDSCSGWFVFGEGTGLADTLGISLPAIALATIGAMLVRITRGRRRRARLRDIRALAGCAEGSTAVARAGAACDRPPAADQQDAVRVDGLVESYSPLPRPRRLLSDSITYKDVPVIAGDCAARRGRHHCRDADR